MDANALSRQPRDLQRSTYHEDSKRPLVCLVFVAPILLVYEIGILWLGNQAARNGIEVLLRRLLDRIGFGQYLLLPVLITAILLAWHHASGQQWRIRIRTLWGMFIESVAFAALLMLVAQSHHWLVPPNESTAQLNLAIQGWSLTEVGQLVGYLGAGIYEELFFRLMLLPCTILALQACGLSNRVSIVSAMLLTSMLFAAAHYQPVNPAGYPLELGDPAFWYSFSFRLSASIFFCCLFLYRGFGVAVGAHAIYDVMTHVL